MKKMKEQWILKNSIFSFCFKYDTIKSNKSASIGTERSNMKKILLIGLFCLCLCGCGKGKELSISELEIKDNVNSITSEVMSSTVYGTIKNNTNKKISSATITLTLKNGDIKKECFFMVLDLEANEMEELDDSLVGCKGSLENYKIVNKKIRINYED